MNLAAMEDGRHSRVEYRIQVETNKIVIQGLLLANIVDDFIRRLTGREICVGEGIQLVSRHDQLFLNPSPYIARIGPDEYNFTRINGLLGLAKASEIATLLCELGLRNALYDAMTSNWTCPERNSLHPEPQFVESACPNYIIDDEWLDAEFPIEEHDNIISIVEDQDLIQRSSYYE